MSKRRTFTSEFKAQVEVELLSGIKSRAEWRRQPQLSPQLLAHWKALFLERAALVFMSEEQRRQEASKTAELERLLGRQTLESQI
jgi:transposase-like protein